mgnify:CR=1 FL=1
MALDYKGKYEFLQRVDENVDVNVGPTTSLATIAFQDSHGFRVVSVHNFKLKVSWVPMKIATSEALPTIIDVAKHKLHNPHKYSLRERN